MDVTVTQMYVTDLIVLHEYCNMFQITWCILLPDHGDVTAETCRRDRNRTALCTVCAYAGFFEQTHILFARKEELEDLPEICGNKMPTGCNRGFYCRSYCLLNMFRAPLCPSSGAQEYYTVVAACRISCCGFSSCWSGVELRVMCPVCRMLQHPANRTIREDLY